MRILSVVGRTYYGQPHAIEPMYLQLTLPLQGLGHQVDHFDHLETTQKIGPAECGEQFVRTVRAGGYDLVLYQTGGQDQMTRGAIPQAAKYAPIVAWNSDDDWQWESYSQHIAPLFTFVVTTYPHIYEAHRKQFPNLLLNQWGALDTYADFGRTKDLDFTFAGQVYRNRAPELRKLWLKAGLKVQGMGSLRIWCTPLNHRGFRDVAAKVFPSIKRAMAFAEVHEIWNRSKISYTPLGASVNPGLLQIKGRVFEMGLSGTLMLCQHSPALERYYECGKEYVSFGNLDECIEKARYYLSHEADRQKIAAAYYRRTKGEHLWEHRWKQLFRDVGIDRSTRTKVA
ncbi:MAG TPA: glycosyltransferase [Humisphaera sp.]|nr:glycosyltransferase [Humisphaera sp.]